MVLVSTSWRMWLAGLAASLAIFAVLFFTVIQPSSNTANQAVKQGLQQSQQALNQAQQQLSTAGAAGTSSGAGAAVTGSAQGPGSASQVVSNTQKLTACVTAAGTNTSAIEACQTKFK